jgi:hypothetical protein
MNQETRDSLNTIFGIPLTEPQLPEVVSANTALTPVDTTGTSPSLYDARKAQEDFEFSRTKLRSLADQSESVLSRAMEVAQQTDKASNFEAASELIQSVIQIHKELRDLHRHTRDIDMTQEENAGSSPVNIEKGVVFSGSPSELLKIIDPSRK